LSTQNEDRMGTTRALSGPIAGPAALTAIVLVAALLAAAWADRAAAASPPSSEQVERRTARYLDSLPGEPSGAVPLRGRGSGGLSEGDGGTGGVIGLFPERRVVAFYGAPQLRATELGKRKPRGAAKRLVRQARPYARQGDRKVIRAFDLIGTIATADRGGDGKYRTRQPDAVIASFLDEIRKRKGRLVLDIQPGRSSVIEELRAHKKWIRQSDVDVAIDPEWNVGKRGVPGRTDGSIRARELNRAGRWMQKQIAARDLPPKALIVHQFREGSVRGRKKLRHFEGVAMTLNFDGIGSRKAKKTGYRNLAQKGIFNGFSLFYALDRGLMEPRAVLRLDPAVDYVMYQ
jgi:hypothetical protein